MSREVQVVFRDDFDKTKEADVSFCFGDGINIYEIDVTDERKAEWDALIAPWIERARLVEVAHITLKRRGELDEKQLRAQRNEQKRRIYKWALQTPGWAETFDAPSGNAVPYLKADLKKDYFAEHPDDPEI